MSPNRLELVLQELFLGVASLFGYSGISSFVGPRLGDYRLQTNPNIRNRYHDLAKLKR